MSVRLQAAGRESDRGSIQTKVLHMGTVLIVDDLEMFRNVLVHALKGAGHHALAAPDGAAALRLVESMPIDLVLLDMAMPVMNGAEFLRRLRGDGRFDHVAVIVVSATSPAPEDKPLLEMGAQAQLLKSRFSLRDLVRRVNEVLNVPV